MYLREGSGLLAELQLEGLRNRGHQAQVVEAVPEQQGVPEGEGGQVQPGEELPPLQRLQQVVHVPALQRRVMEIIYEYTFFIQVQEMQYINGTFFGFQATVCWPGVARGSCCGRGPCDQIRWIGHAGTRLLHGAWPGIHATRCDAVSLDCGKRKG